MALDKELKIQLDEAHSNGATTAELDVIVEEYNSQKKKDQPSLSSGESDSPSRDISLPAESQPQVQETEVESEVVVDPEPEPMVAQPAPKWKDVLAEVYREKKLPAQDLNLTEPRVSGVYDEDGIVTEQTVTDVDRAQIEDFQDSQEYVINKTAFDKWRTSGGIAPSMLSYIENFGDVLVHMGPEYIETISGLVTPGPQPSEFTRAAREEVALKKIKAKADKMAEEGYYFDHKMDPLTAFGLGEGPGDFTEAAAYALETIAGTAPLIAASVVAPQASLPLMFAYGYGAFQADVVNEDWFQDLDPLERLAFGAAGGALEVLPEYVGSRILSRGLKKLAVGQIGEKVFRQATSKYAKGLALGAGLDVTTEAGTEAVTGFGQELLNQYASGQEIDINAAWEAAKTGALLGAVVGGAFTSPGAAADFVTTARSLGKDFSVYKADREIQKLKEVLKNPELTPEQIDVYNEQLRKAFDKKMEATNVSQAFYQRVGLESTEDLNELSRLDLEARSILAKATNNSRYMGEGDNRTRVAVDKKLEGQYQQQLKSIRAQQQAIQNKYLQASTFDSEVTPSAEFTEAKRAGGGLTVDEFIEGNLTGAGRALASAAKNAETLLGDNVKVVMHDGTFDDTMDQVSSSGADRQSGEQGRMIVRNDSGQIEVHIETQRASPLTVAHETFHALFFDQFGQNAEVAQQMVDGLSRVMQGGSKADVALFNRVNDFVQGYEGSVAAEEFAAELFGELTATYRQLSQSGKSKFKNYIVSFIDDLLKTFGINVSSLANMRNEFKTDTDLINFMNSLSRAFQEGTADGAIEETLVVKDQLDTAETIEKDKKKTQKQDRQRKTLPPDATPDELAAFEKEAPARKAEAKKKAAEKKEAEVETKEKQEALDDLQKEREERDLAKAQREDDIRSGKLETLDGLENEQAAINKDMNGVLATMERSRKGTPRKAIQVQDETKYVKRSKSWKKMKAQSPDNFIGETIVTTPSDRMAVAKFVFDDGSTIELKGGYGYAKEVGLPWASSSLTALNKYLKPINKQIKEKGYAYLAPVAMSNASHSSNFQFLLTGLGEIRSAIKNGSTTEAKVRAQLEAISGMKIGKKADVMEFVQERDAKGKLIFKKDKKGKLAKDKEGKKIPVFTKDAEGNRIKVLGKDGKQNVLEVGKDIFLNDLSSALAETNMDKVLDKLEKIFSVENASFESRRNFMSRLLGPTDSEAKNPKAFIDGVISGAELVKRTTDPALIGVPRGYIPGLIKITELIKPYQTSQEADGFQFHESYPWTSKTASGKGVEFIPFTEAVSVTELGNVKTTKGTSVDFESVLKDQGTLDKAVNKYLSNVGMASAAFSVTGEITPEQVEQKKVVADLRKGSKERSRRIQKNYTKAVGKSAGRASAINTNAASIDVFNQDLNLLDIQERSRKINKYAKGNEAGYANNIREKLIDATRKLKEVQKDTEAVGGERSLNQDVINALTLVDPRSAEAVNKFRLSIGLDKVGQGLFKRRAYQKDSLMDRLEKANIDITNLGMILYALHAKEANAYGMMYVDGVLEEMGVPEAAYSGMSDEQANEILVEYGIKTNLKNLQELRDTLGKTNPKLMFALDFMYEVTENTRDTYKKSGMLPGNDKTRVVKRKDKDGKEVTYYQIISAKGTEGSAFLPKDSEAVVIYESKSEQKRDAKLEERLAWANNYEFYVPLKGFAEELEVGTDTPAVEELSLDPVDDADLDKVPDADSRNRVTTKNFLSEVWSKVTAKDQGAEERKERATKQEGIRSRGFEQQDPIRARGGRKGIMAENPALRVLDDHMRAIQNAEKNSVLQKFFNLVTSKDAKELFGDGIKGYKWNPSDKTSETEYSISKDPNKVSVWINGDRHVIEFGEDFSYLAEVITGANQARLVGVVESLGKGTRFISQMLTSYNPGFVPVNLVRDTIMGIYALQGDDVRELIGSQSFAKATATLTGNLPNAWKAIKNVEMGGEIKTPEQKKWADLYKLFKEYGGKTAWVQPLSASEIKEQLNKKLDKVVDGKDTSRGRLMGFLESIEEVNGIFENGSRLSVFAMALENGASPEKAAEVAKNFTVNFNQKGSWGTVLNSLYAFFNAAVQGTAVKTWNLIKSKRGKQIMGSLFALGYFKEMASMFFGGEDDEWIIEYDEKGNPRYRKYSKGEADWAKENSIGQFFGDTWIGVPFAYGLNVFMYAGKRMARLTMDIADDPKDSGSLIAKAVADVTLSTFNSFNPLPIPKSKDSYKGVTRSVVPTVLRYPFDVWANENYFGNSIYPEVQDYMPKDTPAYTLARDNTSRISVNLSKFLNSISNGDQYSKGWINIAPAAIDYIALNYAGGTFKFGQRSVNTLVNTIQAVNKTFEDSEGKDSAQLLNSLKENIEDQVKMNQIPIVRSFVRKPNEFVVYDEWLTMQDELKTYSKRYEDNKTDPALRQLEGFRKTVTSSKGTMGKIAKQIKKVKEALEDLSTLNLSRSVIENRREIYQNRLDSLYEQRNKQQKNLLGIYERIKKRLDN